MKDKNIAAAIFAAITAHGQDEDRLKEVLREFGAEPCQKCNYVASNCRCNAYTVQPDPEPKPDGDIVFRVPELEILRLKGNGSIHVKGKLVETSEEGKATVTAFREWIESSYAILPDGTVVHPSPYRKEDMTFSSGKGAPGGKGGDVIFENKGGVK